MHAVHLNAYIVPSPVYDSDLYRFIIIAQLHIHFHAWLFQFGKGASCIIGTYHTYHCVIACSPSARPSSLLAPPETGATSKGETPTFVLEQD